MSDVQTPAPPTPLSKPGTGLTGGSLGDALRGADARVAERPDPQIVAGPPPVKEASSPVLRRTEEGVTRPIQDLPGGATPQGPEGNAKAASQLLAGLKALGEHSQSIQHYQQQVQQHLEMPFFLVPLWFAGGAGFGHWSWWADHGEGADPEGNAPGTNLLFDLHLQKLGPVKIHLAAAGTSLKLSIAARTEVLPVLRAGLAELKAILLDSGLRLDGLDIFPLENMDTIDPLGVISPGGDGPRGCLDLVT